MKRVGVIGGGVGGLMAAWELSRAGLDVELFEASGELGGLAGGFDFDGLRLDRFYHFICRGDRTLLQTCERLDLADRVRWRRATTGFFHNGHQYNFGSSWDLLRFSPLGMIDKLRFGLHILKARGRRSWAELEQITAKQWLIEGVGERAYAEIWDPLLRIKFDDDHDRVSAAWMWHRIHRVASSRPHIFAREKLGYLVGGSGALLRALEEELLAHQVRIHRRTVVEGLWLEGTRCRGIRVGGETRAYDHVISAVPLPVYREWAAQVAPDYARELEAVRFIGVVCMVLRIRRPITKRFWLNVHDPQIAFNGVIEYSNLDPDCAPPRESIVYIPYYLHRDLERYRSADRALFEEYTGALARIDKRFTPDDVASYRVFRAPYAQPICHTGFAQHVPPHQTPWQGCWMVESTQLYPADRTITGTLWLAQNVARMIVEREGLPMTIPPPPEDCSEIPC